MLFSYKYVGFLLSQDYHYLGLHHKLKLREDWQGFLPRAVLENRKVCDQEILVGLS